MKGRIPLYQLIDVALDDTDAGFWSGGCQRIDRFDAPVPVRPGQGDAKATAIYAQAFKRNPEFYSLYRSLKAYRESFKNKDDIMIVDPSSEFFKYLKKSRGQ